MENKNKAKIVFNGVEKLVEISDEFYTQYRVSNEMAKMAMDEMPFLNVPEEYRETPHIYLPEDILNKVLSETEIDRQYEIVYERLTESIISLIEIGFSLKVDKDCFYHEEYRVSKDNLKNNIVISIIADDAKIN